MLDAFLWSGAAFLQGNPTRTPTSVQDGWKADALDSAPGRVRAPLRSAAPTAPLHCMNASTELFPSCRPCRHPQSLHPWVPPSQAGRTRALGRPNDFQLRPQVGTQHPQMHNFQANGADAHGQTRRASWASRTDGRLQGSMGRVAPGRVEGNGRQRSAKWDRNKSLGGPPVSHLHTRWVTGTEG